VVYRVQAGTRGAEKSFENKCLIDSVTCSCPLATAAATPISTKSVQVSAVNMVTEENTFAPG